MEEVLDFLESVYPLPAELRDWLLLHLVEINLGKGDYLLKAGHISRRVCFIGAGLVRCYYTVRDKQVCSWFMKEGDVIISVESFFRQSPSKESIQALEPCTLYAINYEQVQQLYREYFAFNFIGRVLTEQYYVLSEQRLSALRLQTARERYHNLLENHPDLVQRVPAHYLASYLGMTRFSLSRIRGRKQLC